MILKRIAHSSSGEGFPMVIAVTLCLLLVFLGISEYFRISIIVQGVRDATQQAIIATINDNYDDVYHSVREGYAAGWTPTEDEGWEESIDVGNVYGNLAAILGLTTEASAYAKYSSDELEYRLSELSVSIANNGLASGQSNGFRATASLVLEVPIRFAGKLLSPVRMTLHVEAKYVPKF